MSRRRRLLAALICFQVMLPTAVAANTFALDSRGRAKGSF
jgi:hypothetical protein